MGIQLSHKVRQILVEDFVKASHHALIRVALHFPSHTTSLSVLHRFSFFLGNCQGFAQDTFVQLTLRETAFIQMALDNNALFGGSKNGVVVLSREDIMKQKK